MTDAAEIEVHLDPEALTRQLAEDVRAGLTATPKVMLPKYFYDGHGSDLFDQITRLPEYYPTRTEAAILTAHAADIAAASEADTLVELGSGTSEKTRMLLDALTAAGTLKRFVPFDVDPVILGTAAEQVNAEFPELSVEPMVGDFEQHLGLLPSTGRTMTAFLGSTLGNLDEDQRAAFLATLAGTMSKGDSFLLGVDLVKPVDRLVAAYDDAAGVTAAFNKNVLSVMNASLGADFDLDAFEHRAIWNADHERVEMHLESQVDQVVHVADLDLTVEFASGERMRTEISCKFRRDGIEAELGAAGLAARHWFTDQAHDFALLLARRG